MADLTVAVGSPINYRIETTKEGCYYKVFLRNRETNRVVDIREVVTDENGLAVATFVNAAVGSYELSAQGINCGKCHLPCKNVDVILDCSVNNVAACNPCCGTSATCSGNWNVSPRTFVSGVLTPTSYTFGGVPNCRLKILFYNGDVPVIDNLTSAPLFTYITSGVPFGTNLTWPGAVIGADLNWRVAPMSEQDPCLQNCTISPQRIDIDVTAGANCAINWSLTPQNLAQGEFAVLAVSGAPANCNVVFLQFDGSGNPILGGDGQQLRATVQIDNMGAGQLFVGPCGTAGTQIIRPATGSNQSPCAIGCVFSPSEATITCGTEAVSSTLLVTYNCVDIHDEGGGPAAYYDIHFSGINPAHNVVVEASSNPTDPSPTWIIALTDAFLDGELVGGAYTHHSSIPVSICGPLALSGWVGYGYRIHDITSGVYSNTVVVNCCDESIPDSWYCVSGNCTQNASQPANSTGPFVTQLSCQTACGTPNTGSFSIQMTGFSPAPSPCANISNSVVSWTVGESQSIIFAVTGGASSSVNITGIPPWMTRTNTPGYITLSGAPNTITPFTLTFASPGCNFTWANVVAGGCNITWSISPTTFVHGADTTVTYAATGPAGCYLTIGIYQGSSPITDGVGNPITLNIPCGGTFVANNNWATILTGVNWRVLPGQLPCLAGCNITPQQVNFTIT